MPIELRCPSCNQQLRVPDTAAGKNARCPKCSAIVSVPNASTTAPDAGFSNPQASSPPAAFPQSSAPPASFGAPPASPFAAGPATPTSSPFGFGQPEQKPAAGGLGNSANPFASNDLGAGYNPSTGGFASNPYASPAPISEYGGVGTGKIQPTVVDTGAILNRASKLWQDNLGTLIGATVVYFLIIFVVGFAGGMAQSALMFGGGGKVGLLVVGILLQLVIFALQAFLNTGFMQMCYRICRGQSADIGNLFAGGGQFLPVFLATLIFQLPPQLTAVVGQAMGGPFNQEAQIVTVVVQLGLTLLLGLAMLFLWPVYYVLADGKATFTESFGLALRITSGNILTTFLLGLLTFGILVLGILALCVGILFAMPLVFMMWAVAYLTMSGQISPHQTYQQPFQQPLYR